MPEIKFKSLFRRDIKKYISKQRPESFFLFVVVPDSDWDNNLKKDRDLIAQMGMTPMGKPGSLEAGFIDDRGDCSDCGSPPSFASLCYAELAGMDYEAAWDVLETFYKWKGFAAFELWKDGKLQGENC